MVQKRRLPGLTRGITYGEDDGAEIDFMGSDAKYINNAYNVSRSMTSAEIDTTAYDDYPFSSYEVGLIDFSIDLSMRHAVIDGLLAPDLEFLESHALSRTPFRIAIVDNRHSTTPNGFILSVIAVKADESGDMSSAQDHAYTLKRTSGVLPPKRIVGGVAQEFVIN